MTTAMAGTATQTLEVSTAGRSRAGVAAAAAVAAAAGGAGGSLLALDPGAGSPVQAETLHCRAVRQTGPSHQPCPVRRPRIPRTPWPASPCRPQ